MRNAKPKDLKEVADLNSLMRLMAQPGQELPLDKYVRFKQNIQLWYEEMDNVGVPKVEVPILEKHYLSSYGVPNAQEQLMLLVMDDKVCGYSEQEANAVRKVIGKKLMNKIPDVKKEFFERSKLSSQTTQYIWSTAVEVQLG